MIVKRLTALRAEMKKRGIDAYLIPTADFHQSEYVGGYFTCRKYMTGFTGSAGTALIMPDKAILWTDGRYFIQADKELKGSTVELYRMGEEGVPTISKFLEDYLHEGSCLGFDGRVMDSRQGKNLGEIAEKKGASVRWDEDLVDLIWEDRPALSCAPAWSLDVSYVGKSREDKIADVRRAMAEAGADVHIITTLDDIAWLFNIRGGDVACNPVVLSYAMLTAEQAILFVQSQAVGAELKAELEAAGVELREYSEFYSAVAAVPADKAILLDQSKISYALLKSLSGDAKIVDKQNPTVLMKAVKTPVEMENMRKAHIKDGAALTKFIYWMKKNVGTVPMDEYSVGEKLEEFRKEQEGFLDNSFGAICAYGPNAAQCHYSASKDNCAVIEPKGLFLCDSGGQYYEGTTDVTRTWAVGPLTDEEKLHFTLVMKGMLNLAAAKFIYGCRGINLDYLARGPLWEHGLDFNHGTGHGVGYLLNVHEAPNGFRWRIVPERNDSCVLEEGMITSDEPGLYIEGSHGIRTENLILCKKAEKNQYGQFMEFEHLTMAPIDLDAVVVELLNETDKKRLNDYHRDVYEKLAPFMNDEEKAWLAEATRAI
ncbi:MAG: aminopeptidase P family protein [Lachnospiraceae bacterium]|nr:aminopeptidase P family protein [Lachnospiraceae bacterium]